MIYRSAPAPVSRGKREDKKKMLNSWARAGSKNACFGPVMRRSTSEGFPHKTHLGICTRMSRPANLTTQEPCDKYKVFLTWQNDSLM